MNIVADGTLDDPDFVRAICKAATKPELWKLVSPSAQEMLFLPELQIRQLGGTRNDLLAMLLEAHEYNSPENRNYFSSPGAALELVKLWLDLERQKRLDVIVASAAKRRDTGRRTVANARAKKTEKAVERRKKLQRDIEQRMAAGKSRPVAIGAVAKAQGVTPGAIRKKLPSRTHKNANN